MRCRYGRRSSAFIVRTISGTRAAVPRRTASRTAAPPRSSSSDVVAHVEAERRLEIHPQMRAEVVDDPLGVARLAGDVGLGELRVEAGVLADARDGDVIGVGVHRVRNKQPIRPVAADHRGQLVPGLDRVHHLAVGQADAASARRRGSSPRRQTPRRGSPAIQTASARRWSCRPGGRGAPARPAARSCRPCPVPDRRDAGQ